jgi:hypothetical protein
MCHYVTDRITIKRKVVRVVGFVRGALWVLSEVAEMAEGLAQCVRKDLASTRGELRPAARMCPRFAKVGGH